MALPSESAPEAQGVITETYGDLEILVPEGLREYSAELLENQKRAIDFGAVLGEDVNRRTVDYLDLGWTLEQPRHCCWHMNIPPVRREEFCATHPALVPLSLTERKRFIVAGVVAVSISESLRLPRERICKNLEIEWSCFQKLSRNHLTHLPLRPYTYKLENILRSMCANATRSQLQKDFNYYRTILGSHQLKTNVPAWWPQRLSSTGLKELRNHDLIHVTACILSHHENKVSSDVRNQEPWTATVREVWKEYQSSGLSENPWQPRHPSTPTTSGIHASTQLAMTSVQEDTTRYNPDDSLSSLSSPQSQHPSNNEHERETPTCEASPLKEPVAAPTPIHASATSTSDLCGLEYILQHRIVSLRHLIPKWLAHLEPNRESEYGSYSDQLLQNHPYWPSDVPYSSPLHLTTAQQRAIGESILRYYLKAITQSVKRREDWTAELQEVWVNNEESPPSENRPQDQLEVRVEADLNTQTHREPTENVSEDCFSSINDMQGDVKSRSEKYYHYGGSSTNLPISAPNPSTNYEMDVPLKLPPKQYASGKSTSSVIEDEEDVHTCQLPQAKRRCVHPISQAITTQCVLGTPEHNLKNAAYHMPYSSITTPSTLPVSGINTMKRAIRKVHLELSTANMLEVLNMYMSNLEVLHVPASVPFWWPPELDDEEYINFDKENLISVAAHLLLHHRSRFHRDLRDSKPWTARFQKQNIPICTSQAAVSHPLRILTKEDSSDTSFAPPQSTMPTVSECSSSVVDLKPLSASASSEDVWKRLGLDKKKHIHKSLLEDANKARDSLSSDPDEFSNARTSPTTQRAYKWAEISATAKHKKALEMANNAPTDLVQYYKLGEYKTKVARENWVAMWYLRCSFRYRDNRSKRSKGGCNFEKGSHKSYVFGEG